LDGDVKAEEALVWCEETVHRLDPDRYLASLFAPAAKRPQLFALYAFNLELARLSGRSREPAMGAVRLQWWRETVEEARIGRPRAHPVAIGLAELFARSSPPPNLFETILDAREFDFADESFASVSALESYCESTSSAVMRVADTVIDDASGAEPALRHAGIAYAIAGLLRAIPFHAARRRLYLPGDVLSAEHVSAEDIFAGKNTPGLVRAVHMLCKCARGHLDIARKDMSHRRLRVAALPAALVPLTVKGIERPNFDPFRDAPDIALFRKQLALARAALFGRI
jgi:phytoene synthase